MLKVANSVINASRITGVLPVVNGGTGVTTSTGTGNTVLSASPTFSGTAVFAALSSSGALSVANTATAYAAVLSNGIASGNGLLTVVRSENSFATRGTGVVFTQDYTGLTNYANQITFSTSGTAANNSLNFEVCDGGPTTRVVGLSLLGTGVAVMPNYGAGTATFSAAGVISSVSDETWKTKDGVPTDPDAMLKKLEPGYWYYNDEKKETFGVDRQLGFYAQNVNAAIGPEAAPTPEEGKPWGYHDRSVLAITVMSLQKALATIDSLTARIAVLESKCL